MTSSHPDLILPFAVMYPVSTAAPDVASQSRFGMRGRAVARMPRRAAAHVTALQVLGRPACSRILRPAQSP